MNIDARSMSWCVALSLCNLLFVARVEAVVPPRYACENESEMFRTLVQASRKAGFDPEYRPSQESGVSIQTRQMRDGVNLVGYLIAARDGAEKPVSPRGYVLVFLGNALLAQQTIGDLKVVARQELDVYVFDYRGYGLSQGTPAILDIIDDARELILDLNISKASNGSLYEQHLLLGLSAGAVVISMVDGAEKLADRIAFDGAPSRTSIDVKFLFFSVMKLKCPARLDLENSTLPFAKKTLIVQGTKDRVLGVTQVAGVQSEFLRTACEKGSTVIQAKGFKHPFQDQFGDKRFGLIGAYLLSGHANVEDWPKGSQGCGTLLKSTR
jgi:hypothetical protein